MSVVLVVAISESWSIKAEYWANADPISLTVLLACKFFVILWATAVTCAIVDVSLNAAICCERLLREISPSLGVGIERALATSSVALPAKDAQLLTAGVSRARAVHGLLSTVSSDVPGAKAAHSLSQASLSTARSAHELGIVQVKE